MKNGRPCLDDVGTKVDILFNDEFGYRVLPMDVTMVVRAPDGHTCSLWRSHYDFDVAPDQDVQGRAIRAFMEQHNHG